tara:strand:- start:1178 stop:2056 length:879 start_codon:yes stop_codon:yes gene_type:complete
MKVLNIIIITILVLIVIFLISRLFFNTDIIYDILCDANETAVNTQSSSTVQSYFTRNKNVITNKEFNENNTSNFMLSVWFYVDNWGNNISNEKNILYISTNPNSITVPDLQNNLIGISSSTTIASTTGANAVSYKNLSISLDKYENNLFLDIETYPETGVASSTTRYTYTRYLIKNIPIQKWNCLTLSVDTKTFDVYLDGKLRNSFILQGIYRNKIDSLTKNIYIGHLTTINTGFEGYITRIRYQPNAVNPQEAYNIYKEGINASLGKSIYNKYGLKVSFLEYNKERGNFTI